MIAALAVLATMGLVFAFGGLMIAFDNGGDRRRLMQGLATLCVLGSVFGLLAIGVALLSIPCAAP